MNSNKVDKHFTQPRTPIHILYLQVFGADVHVCQPNFINHISPSCLSAWDLPFKYIATRVIFPKQKLPTFVLKPIDGFTLGLQVESESFTRLCTIWSWLTLPAPSFPTPCSSIPPGSLLFLTPCCWISSFIPWIPTAHSSQSYFTHNFTAHPRLRTAAPILAQVTQVDNSFSFLGIY